LEADWWGVAEGKNERERERGNLLKGNIRGNRGCLRKVVS